MGFGVHLKEHSFLNGERLSNGDVSRFNGAKTNVSVSTTNLWKLDSGPQGLLIASKDKDM